LKRRAEFLRVAAERTKWVAPGLVLQARPRSHDARDPLPADAIRVGFTVSRKVGGAVARNRARRRLRAAMAAVLPTHGRAGFDYVVVGRQATLTRPFEALIGDLTAALARLGRPPRQPRPDAGAGQSSANQASAGRPS
jgi:ribonuclease P protein component